MGGHRSLLIGLVATLCAPTVAASDPFYEEVCPTSDVCVGAGMCVDAMLAYTCIPRGCSIGISCYAEVGPDSAECAFNTTIDGQTCSVHVAFGMDTADSDMSVAAQLSNGSVSSTPLENTWVSPGAESRLKVLGLDFGSAYAYAYRSDIQTEGPRGGPFGLLSPAQHHTWTEVGVAAGHHGGPAFGEDVVVAVELMDFMPEGCWLRSPSGAVPEVECPRLGPIYRLIPLA